MVDHLHFSINFDWVAFENYVNIIRKFAVNSLPWDTKVDTLVQLELAFVNFDTFNVDKLINVIINLDLQK
jgi:hypothetical protein